MCIAKEKKLKVDNTNYDFRLYRNNILINKLESRNIIITIVHFMNKTLFKYFNRSIYIGNLFVMFDQILIENFFLPLRRTKIHHVYLLVVMIVDIYPIVCCIWP